MHGYGVLGLAPNVSTLGPAVPNLFSALTFVPNGQNTLHLRAGRGGYSKWYERGSRYLSFHFDLGTTVLKFQASCLPLEFGWRRKSKLALL